MWVGVLGKEVLGEGESKEGLESTIGGVGKGGTWMESCGRYLGRF